MLAVESAASLRATAFTSLMNSNFSSPAAECAMRPNFVKLSSVP